MFEQVDDPGSAPVVKICGLTTPEDAAAALEYGADALGFNFFPDSRRPFSWEIARRFVETNPQLRVILAGG
jgi:phosphoribosylanthranilate isomerase